MGATVAIIAAARKKRIQDALDAFRVAGATSPERASAYDRLGISHSSELDELEGAGVLVQGPRPGTWYLNEGAYVEYREGHGRKARYAIFAVMAVIVILAGIMFALAPGGQR